MRRALVVLAVAVAVVAVARWRHHAAPPNNGALALAIVSDVAQLDRRDVSWNVHGAASSAKLSQHEHVKVTGNASRAHVASADWRLELNLSDVFAIQCHITGGDVGDTPEYGLISFLPEDGDVFDTLFSVGFPEASIDALERICAAHGLPVRR